mmetsp:Transcript_113366/g.361771  ORF Transcript_113366/g.361771 Transcript_113366/m.361771 type:complete len:241 (-) Transcript_113366:173-895(-)
MSSFRKSITRSSWSLSSWSSLACSSPFSCCDTTGWLPAASPPRPSHWPSLEPSCCCASLAPVRPRCFFSLRLSSFPPDARSASFLSLAPVRLRGSFAGGQGMACGSADCPLGHFSASEIRLSRFDGARWSRRLSSAASACHRSGTFLCSRALRLSGCWGGASATGCLGAAAVGAAFLGGLPTRGVWPARSARAAALGWGLAGGSPASRWSSRQRVTPLGSSIRRSARSLSSNRSAAAAEP